MSSCIQGRFPSLGQRRAIRLSLDARRAIADLANDLTPERFSGEEDAFPVHCIFLGGWVQMLFASIFSISVGFMMLVQWTVTLVRRGVPEKDEGISGRGKREMLFHWAAESLTSIALVFSGAAMLLGWRGAHASHLVATGMLIYTVINSAGWFAERREWAMVGVFAVLLIGAGIGLACVL